MADKMLFWMSKISVECRLISKWLQAAFLSITAPTTTTTTAAATATTSANNDTHTHTHAQNVYNCFVFSSFHTRNVLHRCNYTARNISESLTMHSTASDFLFYCVEAIAFFFCLGGVPFGPDINDNNNKTLSEYGSYASESEWNEAKWSEIRMKNPIEFNKCNRELPEIRFRYTSNTNHYQVT